MALSPKFTHVGSMSDVNEAFERLKRFKKGAKQQLGRRFKDTFPYFRLWKNRFRALRKLEHECLVLLVCRPIGLSRHNKASRFSPLEELEHKWSQGQPLAPAGADRIGEEDDGYSDEWGAEVLQGLFGRRIAHCFLLVISCCDDVGEPVEREEGTAKVHRTFVANFGADPMKDYTTFFDPTALWYPVGIGCKTCKCVSQNAPRYAHPPYNMLGPNSNTFVAQVIKKCGLEDPFKNEGVMKGMSDPIGTPWFQTPQGWTTEVTSPFPP